MKIDAQYFLDRLAWVPDWWFLDPEKTSLCKRLEESKWNAKATLSRQSCVLRAIILSQLITLGVIVVPAASEWWWSGKLISWHSVTICALSVITAIAMIVGMSDTRIAVSEDEAEAINDINDLFPYCKSKVTLWWPAETTYSERVEINKDISKSRQSCLNYVMWLAGMIDRLNRAEKQYSDSEYCLGIIKSDLKFLREHLNRQLVIMRKYGLVSISKGQLFELVTKQIVVV
jgi:hypothetical protein